MYSTRLSISSKELGYDWLYEDQEKRNNVLAKAKRENVTPQCLCRGKHTPLPLYITHRGKHHFLAKMPGTGGQHRHDCPFFSPRDVDSGRGTYQGAFKTQSDGRDTVRFEFPLSRKPNATHEKKDIPPAGTYQHRRGKVSLLGFLHELWTRADLIRWHPGFGNKRSWGVVQRRLYDALDELVYLGNPLSKRTYIPRPFNKDKSSNNNKWRDKLFARYTPGSAYDSPQRMLVVGQLKSIEEGKFSLIVKLKHDNYPFYVKSDVLDKAYKRFRLALKDIQDPSKACIVIMVVEFTLNGNATVYDLAAMPTTPRFIPFDSSYEHELADILIDSSYSFTKPMRYDADKDVVFPDFLLDVPGYPDPIPMEIYGMNGLSEYDKRKQEKIAHYKSKGSPYWHWDLSAQDTPPPLCFIYNK